MRTETSTLTGGTQAVGHKQEGYRTACGRCGAWRVDRQLGLEATPDDYVSNLVGVFREVRRVLREDGSLWLVLGDSYNAGRDGGHPGGKKQWKPERAKYPGKSGANVPGLKPKDLIGVPWRVALALQADGWYLRSAVIWAKPNPTPESVTDRPTRSHEYVLLLTKARRYYYDATAIAEPAIHAGLVHHEPNTWTLEGDHRPIKSSVRSLSRTRVIGATRNRRSVWTIPTVPFRGAHFATFPPALAELCVLAGSAPRACERCGAPWKRLTARRTARCGGSGRAGRSPEEVNASGKWAGRQHGATLKLGPVVSTTTVGWAPTCECPDATVSAHCAILDCFGGAGTTGLVAARAGRDAVLIELNPDYVELARTRIVADAPLVNRVTVVNAA